MEVSNTLFASFLFVILFAAELIYFRVARRFRIIDKPNERSSHLRPVIRGGGVIFFVASVIWYATQGGQWPWFMLGLLLVAVISFMDDLYPQKAGVRFAAHLTAMLLLFYQADLFDWPAWLVITALVVCIGTLNAFNFMDGINGITGVYSLVTLLSFFYIHETVHAFTSESFLLALCVSLLVFLFFNFRKRAKCFAGDVGSVTIAFAIVFLLLQLITETDNFVWVLFVLVYGTDSVITIIYRLVNRENIFKAHRSHLYQYMSNEMGVPHLLVSALYGGLQLIINGIVVFLLHELNVATIIFLLSFMVCYTVVREAILKRVGVRGLFIRPLTG